jgi:NAD(P)-dependent dehydrogenase (short-subunit alcohol dehydrogenase family)
VIVTGAGQGIGRAHALAFGANGDRVVVNDMGESADETAALVREAGGEAVVSKGDVSDWSYGEELVKTAVAEFGQLDALVNNAGLVRDRMLVNMSEEEWDLVVKVDLKGHFVPLRHASA